MRQLTTYRNLQVFLVIMAVIGMSFALFFLQRYMGFSPCPLCIFQRIGLMVMGGFALIAAIFDPKSKIVRLLLWLGSLAGIGWAAVVACCAPTAGFCWAEAESATRAKAKNKRFFFMMRDTLLYYI